MNLVELSRITPAQIEEMLPPDIAEFAASMTEDEWQAWQTNAIRGLVLGMGRQVREWLQDQPQLTQQQRDEIAADIDSALRLQLEKQGHSQREVH